MDKPWYMVCAANCNVCPQCHEDGKCHSDNLREDCYKADRIATRLLREASRESE